MMKQWMMMALAVALVGCTTTYNFPPAKPAEVAPSPKADVGTSWQQKNGDALRQATDAATIKQLLASDESAAALAGEVKTGYASDPMKMAQIAAASQFVMTPDGAEFRKRWVKALFAAAEKAEYEDTVIMLIDQLRWCACAKCADHIKALGMRSPRVKEIADLAATEVKGKARVVAIDRPYTEAPAVEGVGVKPVESVATVVAAFKTFKKTDKQTLAALRRQQTSAMEGPLEQNFAGFSTDGKVATLRWLRERKSAVAKRLVPAAQAAAAQETNERAKERLLEEINKIK